jgi:hypothetical protein
MLMSPSNKDKITTLIIGRMGKESKKHKCSDSKPCGCEATPEDTNHSAEEMKTDASLGLEMAAEDMMKAIERKDTKVFIGALKAFISMCEEENMFDEEESY